MAAMCSLPPAMLHFYSKPHHPTHPVAATFCVPTKGSLQLMAMSLHPISLSSHLCSLEAVLLSPLHCSLPPCQDLHTLSRWTCQVWSLGLPKVSQALGWAAVPGQCPVPTQAHPLGMDQEH